MVHFYAVVAFKHVHNGVEQPETCTGNCRINNNIEASIFSKPQSKTTYECGFMNELKHFSLSVQKQILIDKRGVSNIKLTILLKIQCKMMKI